MKAIICDKKSWQALEDKIYQALVANKVIVPYVNDEKEEVLPLNYSSLRQNPKTGEFAFEVKPEAEKYLTKVELARAVELDWTWFCGKNTIRGHKVTQYWCAYSDDMSKFATGITPVGLQTTTGQPHLLVADTEAELEKKVDAIFGVGYYQKQVVE